jgi:hypothetical protein
MQSGFEQLERFINRSEALPTRDASAGRRGGPCHHYQGLTKSHPLPSAPPAICPDSYREGPVRDDGKFNAVIFKLDKGPGLSLELIILMVGNPTQDQGL